MSRWIAAACVAAVAAICSAAQAHADSESDYLDALSRIGGGTPIPIDNQQKRAALLMIGYTVCAAPQDRASRLDALDRLGVDVAADPVVAGELVTAATTYLCPTSGAH
jgi:hypothetical protein